MKKLAVTAALAVGFLLAGAGSAHGQVATVAVNFTIPQVLTISADAAAVTINVVNADVGSGLNVVGATPTVLTFSGNVPMDLDLGAATFTTAPTNNPKAITDLLWDVTAGQGTGANGDLGAGGNLVTALAPGAGYTSTVQYSLAPVTFTDEAGTYQANAVYTLSAN